MRRFSLKVSATAAGRAGNCLSTIATSGKMEVRPFVSQCRAAADLIRHQPSLESPTAKYLQQSRSAGVVQAVEHEAERLTLSSSSSAALATMSTDALIDTILLSRSLSAFHEHCEELILRERKKLYAIHRPTTAARPTPSDYIRLFAKARIFLRNVTHASLQHPVVMQLLDMFMELWRKPMDPRACGGSAAGEWFGEGDGTQRAVVAAALFALPPHDCLLAIEVRLLGDDAVATYRRSTALGEEAPVPSAVHLILWCVSMHSEEALVHLSKQHRASKGVVDAIKRVQSSEVIGAAVSALILMGTRESKQRGIDVCEAYLTFRMHAPTAGDDSGLTTLMASASEAAAVIGDSELVTRCIFMLFRAKGALADDGTTSATALSGASSSARFASAIRSWLPSQAHKTTSSGATSFDDTVAHLLRNAIKSACIECGIAQAQKLFDALRTGCTWKAIACMGLELLEAHEQHNLNAPHGESHAQDAYAILGRMASAYPRQPSVQDERWLHVAVTRTMRLHFSFVHAPRAIAGDVSAAAPVVWALPRNPRRALELYERLPGASSLRRDVRPLAVAAAAALPAVDGMQTLEALLREELGSNANNDAVCSDFVSNGGQRACAMAATLLHGILTMPHGSICMPSEWDVFARHDETLVQLCHVVSMRGSNVFRADVLLSWVARRLQRMQPSQQQDASVAQAMASALLSQSWVSEVLDVKAIKEQADHCLAEAILCATGVAQGAATVMAIRSAESDTPRVAERRPSSPLVLLHPSVAFLPPQRFSAFVLELAKLSNPSDRGDVALVVPWEMTADNNSASANRLRSLINANGSAPTRTSTTWAIAAVPTHHTPISGMTAAGKEDGHQAETLLHRYALAIKAMLHARGLGNEVVVWCEDASGVARLGSVRVVSTSTNDRRKALHDIQQLLHAGDVSANQTHAVKKGGALGSTGPPAAGSAGVPLRRNSPSPTVAERRASFGGLRDKRK